MRTEVIRPFSYKKPGCALHCTASIVHFFKGEQYNNHVLINAGSAGTAGTKLAEHPEDG